MKNYTDLIKALEKQETQTRVTLILPHPIEEIFPEKQRVDVSSSQEALLKKDYENLVATAFDRRC